MRISQISADIAVTIQSGLKSSLAFSIAFNESTDIQDNTQLAIFDRLVSSDLTIKAIRETTRGVDTKRHSTKL